MPTRNEAFGLVYQEAAAAGLPAIGSRLNAVPEIIDDGVTGLLVTPGMSRRLAQALDRLIASAELRERLGRERPAQDRARRRPAASTAVQLVALIGQVASIRQAADRHG